MIFNDSGAHVKCSAFFFNSACFDVLNIMIWGIKTNAILQ